MTALHSPATATDLLPILERQRGALLSDGPPSARQRRASLHRLQETLLARQPEINSALAQDFSQRAPQESLLSDIWTTVSATAHLSRHLTSWMKPERRSVAFHFQPGRAWVESQPLGVVGVIAPWNYPLSLALIPLATALAAGNRVMLKPSEYTPATSGLMAELLAGIFPIEQVAVVTGGAEIGAAFASLPFDLLCFTGSTSVGRAVMRAASENLVPVVLELGGKSPALIDSDYPLERAARSVAHGKLVNAGQTCIAPDYVLVPADRAERFAQEYTDQVRALYPRWAENPDYCAIINQRHFDRLTGLVRDARAKGATVIEVEPAGAPGVAGRKFPPTLLLGGTADMKVMQDEIFGPILPVVTYTDLREALWYINARARPLALYYFGSQRDRQQLVLSGTTSGGVTINDTVLHYLQDSLPFGGVGPSGMGCYHGIEGFRQFSHRKAVFRQASINAVDLLRPPYSKRFDRIMKVLMPS
jgi:coniferyl-aldehyde dehydrogenase